MGLWSYGGGLGVAVPFLLCDQVRFSSNLALAWGGSSNALSEHTIIRSPALHVNCGIAGGMNRSETRR